MENKRKLEIISLNDGVTYDIDNKEDAIQAIFEEYNRFDISMNELLETIELSGFSVQDVVDIYAKTIKLSDNDELSIKIEEETINRWDW